MSVTTADIPDVRDGVLGLLRAWGRCRGATLGDANRILSVAQEINAQLQAAARLAGLDRINPGLARDLADIDALVRDARLVSTSRAEGWPNGSN